MSSMILINTVQVAGTKQQAGSSYDSVKEASTITAIQAAGGTLLPVASLSASQLANAQALKLRGGTWEPDAAVSLVLLAALLGALGYQVVQGVTLVAGTVDIATGITVTSKTVALLQLRTPGGTMGIAVKAAYTVGDPGTGKVTLTSVAADGSTVATDTSVYDVVLLG